MIQTIPLAALLLPFASAPGDEIAPRPLAEDEELAPLAALWADRMDTFDVPGAAVAVVRDGEVFVHAMGVRDADGRLAVDAHTMFYIASITKTFTAMAACALVEDGLVELDDPVAELLPRFDLPDGHEEIEESATLRDLLSHRWGINSGPVVLLDAYTGEITDERYWHWLARGSVAGRPVYTNVNFTLAGQIVEEAAGKDWRDWLQTRVLEPAGMTRTTGYASRLYGDPNSAVPMERGADGFVPTAQRKTDRTMHAAGGLGISAADGARWVLLNLGHGAIADARVLDADLMEEMHFPHQELDRGSILRVVEQKGFCLGWQQGVIEGVPVRMHGGGYVGAFAFVALLHEHDAGFFLLANSGGLANAWGMAVAADITRAVTGAERTSARWEQLGRLAERSREDGEGDGPATTTLAAEHLSRPIGLYVGAFRNEWLGTLHVERSGAGLAFRLGDAPRRAEPAGEVDTFRLDGGAARFIVGPGGEIDEIRDEIRGMPDTPFLR